jgi:AcrR family transcriptional regulator
MVSAGDIERVSMESVADRAGVSRALVYKHFANRGELLSAVYERESAHLHASMAAKVEQAGTLEDMLRALVEGALAAQASRGATFAALAASGSRPPQQRSIQRRRDAQTLRFFTRRAVAELGLDEPVARTALDVTLSTIPVVLSQWRQRATAAHAADLADIYVSMTIGGLKALSRPRLTKPT